MNITIFGTGYVGLVTGVCFASIGHDVLCVDIDAAKISALQAGNIPIYEPGLDSVMRASVADKKLTFTSNLEDPASHSSIFFIAVGTPQAADGSANLDYVLSLAKDLGRRIATDSIVVVKSTVPVGTADRIRHVIENELRLRFSHPPKVEIVSNPEFLKEGHAVQDFMSPDRVIIGSENETAAKIVLDIYEPLGLTEGQLLVMDNKSAELTKYAANAMLATRISFMNQIANICEKTGADIDQVKMGIGSDTRIGSDFLNAGVGYGGSCFPKDVKALIRISEVFGADGSKLLEAVDRVNDDQKLWHIRKCVEHFKVLENLVIGVWGLSFKPNTDDIREATSVRVIGALIAEGAKVRAYDPIAGDIFRERYGHESLYLCSTADEALEGIDALFVLTEWDEFRSFDREVLKRQLTDRALFDGRNIFTRDDFGPEIVYYSVGRK